MTRRKPSPQWSVSSNAESPDVGLLTLVTSYSVSRDCQKRAAAHGRYLADPTVTGPRFHEEIHTNRCGVVPQVVAIGIRVARETSAAPGSIARVGIRAFEVSLNSTRLCDGCRRQDDGPVRGPRVGRSGEERGAAVDESRSIGDKQQPPFRDDRAQAGELFVVAVGHLDDGESPEANSTTSNIAETCRGPLVRLGSTPNHHPTLRFEEPAHRASVSGWRTEGCPTGNCL